MQERRQHEQEASSLEAAPSAVIEQQSGVLEPTAIWQTAWDEFEQAVRTPLASLQSPPRR